MILDRKLTKLRQTNNFSTVMFVIVMMTNFIWAATVFPNSVSASCGSFCTGCTAWRWLICASVTFFMDLVNVSFLSLFNCNSSRFRSAFVTLFFLQSSGVHLSTEELPLPPWRPSLFVSSLSTGGSVSSAVSVSSAWIFFFHYDILVTKLTLWTDRVFTINLTFSSLVLSREDSPPRPSMVGRRNSRALKWGHFPGYSMNYKFKSNIFKTLFKLCWEYLRKPLHFS